MILFVTNADTEILALRSVIDGLRPFSPQHPQVRRNVMRLLAEYPNHLMSDLDLRRQ